jgi:type IV secretory pathway VirB2 component (pilin)
MIRMFSAHPPPHRTATASLRLSSPSAGAHAAARPCRGKRRSSRSSKSIEGPVAKIIAVIIIIVTGLTLAFGDTSGGFRRLIQIVFGLSIAFAGRASSCRSSPSAAGRWSDDVSRHGGVCRAFTSRFTAR